MCFHSRISDFVFPFMNIKIFQIEHRNLNFFNNLIKEVIGYVKGHGKSYLSRTVQIAFFLLTASNITNEAPAFENAGAKIKTNINKEGLAYVGAVRRSGDDLLSRVLRQSTISAKRFNGRVRNGIGFRLLARTTRPAKDRREASCLRSFISSSRRCSKRSTEVDIDK